MAEMVVIGADGHFAEAERDAVHAGGCLHYCVHCIVTHNGRIYLQRRKANRKRNPNRWTSTVSGHITAEDARDHQQLMINQHSALVALRHEFEEELGLVIDVDQYARYLGQTRVVSRGDEELCNCETLVFAMEYSEIGPVVTEEVEEVVPFTLQEVTDASTSGAGLPGKDGSLYGFADNFAPVLQLFLQRSR